MQNSTPLAVKRPSAPPRRPIFGIRVHPLVGLLVAAAIVGAVVLVICASDTKFMPQFNPFADMPFDPR